MSSRPQSSSTTASPMLLPLRFSSFMFPQRVSMRTTSEPPFSLSLFEARLRLTKLCGPACCSSLAMPASVSWFSA
eukprot:13364871-Heterocapsa_arctica.AAC.1